jgi:hypothetical protein
MQLAPPTGAHNGDANCGPIMTHQAGSPQRSLRRIALDTSVACSHVASCFELETISRHRRAVSPRAASPPRRVDNSLKPRYTASE